MADFMYSGVQTGPSNLLIPKIFLDDRALEILKARKSGVKLDDIARDMGLSRTRVYELSSEYGRCALSFNNSTGLWPADVDLGSSVAIDLYRVWEELWRAGFLTLQDLEGFKASQLILMSYMQFAIVEKLAAEADNYDVNFERDFKLAKDVKAAKAREPIRSGNFGYFLWQAAQKFSKEHPGIDFDAKGRRSLFGQMASLMVDDGVAKPIDRFGIRSGSSTARIAVVDYNHLGESDRTAEISLR